MGGGEGGQLLLDFLSIYTKKKKKKENHFCFPGQESHSSQQELKEQQHRWDGGSFGLTLGARQQQRGPRNALCHRDPWHNFNSLWAWGLGGPPAGSWGQSGLGGLCVASGRPGSPPLLPGKLPTSPHSIPNSSAREDGRFIAPVTRAHGRGWRVRGRVGGARLGDRARVRLSYGPSAGTSIFPEGLSAGPGQPPGVSAGLGVSARVRAGHLCKCARMDWA